MGFLLSEQFWATASVVATVVAAVIVPWLSDRAKKKRTQAELDTEADRQWFEGRNDFHSRITEKAIINESGFDKGWDHGPELDETDPGIDHDGQPKPRG